MSRWIRSFFRSGYALLGGALLSIALLFTVLGYLSTLDWVLGLKNNSNALALANFVLTPFGRLVTTVLVDVGGLLCIYRAVKDQLPKDFNPALRFVSVTNIKGLLVDKAYIPEGNSRFLTICSIYNNGVKVQNVRAELSVSDERGTKLFSVLDVRWLAEERTAITIRKGTLSHLILGSWAYNELVMIPYILSGKTHEHPLDAGDYGVAISLFEGDQSISSFYMKLRVTNSVAGATPTESERVNVIYG